jgi:hypothetical protein
MQLIVVIVRMTNHPRSIFLLKSATTFWACPNHMSHHTPRPSTRLCLRSTS